MKIDWVEAKQHIQTDIDLKIDTVIYDFLIQYGNFFKLFKYTFGKSIFKINIFVLLFLKVEK